MKKLEKTLQDAEKDLNEGIPTSDEAKKALKAMDTAVKSGTTKGDDKSVLKQAITIMSKYA